MHGSDSTSSRRGVLGPLQADLLARLSAALPDFFLTGGSALAEFYLGHRRSEDLDLFTARVDAFADADAHVRQVAADSGIAVVVVRSSSFFRMGQPEYAARYLPARQTPLPFETDNRAKRLTAPTSGNMVAANGTVT